MTEVVVGVDGSAGSARALAWAVEQAAMTGELVRAVYAYTLPHAGPEGTRPAPAVGVHARAQQLVDKAVDDLLGGRPDVKAVAEALAVRSHSAAQALVAAARRASLLVVGSRGIGGFTGLLVGSVSAQCVEHARCPVVVVRDSSSAGTSSSPTCAPVRSGST